MEIPHPLNDWSKIHNGLPGISVRQHLLTVASVAEALLCRYPSVCKRCGITTSALLFLAASHDVGKLSLDFLQKSSVWLTRQGLEKKAAQGDWKTIYNRPHPRISCDSLYKFLVDRHLAPRKSAACWAAVVGAHHGRISRSYSSAPLILKSTERLLEDERQKCLEELWEHFGRPKLPDIQNRDDPVLWYLAGLVTLADWIGSDERFFPPDTPLDAQTLQQRSTEAVESIGLGLPPVAQGLSFADIFAGRAPYPLQEKVAAAIRGPGIHIIEAPMGMGKTEAALWAAYHLLAQGQAEGIFFALPTQATSNRIFLRFADFVRQICLRAAPIQLIHGNSWLQEDLKALVCPPSPDKGADPCWFNTARRSLFAPFGVGTVDQALLAVLAVRHFALRRFALAGKVVIVDEVHTYDIYTGTLVRYLCRELERLGCTVIVLSATLTECARCSLLSLPAEEERRDAPYPRISGRTGDSVLPELCPPSLPEQRFFIEHPGRDHALIQAVELARQGAQILWICNTVTRAQEDFSALRQLVSVLEDKPNTGLLHSRFPFYRRESLEEEWMGRLGPKGSREKGAILVSTQIVEQSVDLDADVLFSELAPTDMLLQRLGRLWRHPRNERPVKRPLFCLLRETASYNDFRQMSAPAIRICMGEKALVYSPYVLLRTLEVWEALDSLSLPTDIRNLMAATYAEQDVPQGWEELYAEDYGKELADRRLADMGTDIWQAALDDSVALKTRLSADTALMVLGLFRDGNRLSLLEGTDTTLSENGRHSLSVARMLHRNAVRIPCSWLAGKPQDSRLMPYYIDGWLLVENGSISTPHLRPGRKLYWDEDLGVIIRKEER